MPGVVQQDLVPGDVRFTGREELLQVPAPAPPVRVREDRPQRIVLAKGLPRFLQGGEFPCRKVFAGRVGDPLARFGHGAVGMLVVTVAGSTVVARRGIRDPAGVCSSATNVRAMAAVMTGTRIAVSLLVTTTRARRESTDRWYFTSTVGADRAGARPLTRGQKSVDASSSSIRVRECPWRERAASAVVPGARMNGSTPHGLDRPPRIQRGGVLRSMPRIGCSADVRGLRGDHLGQCLDRRHGRRGPLVR